MNWTKENSSNGKQEKRREEKEDYRNHFDKELIAFDWPQA